jgi:hypothetical protein
LASNEIRQGSPNGWSFGEFHLPKIKPSLCLGSREEPLALRRTIECYGRESFADLDVLRGGDDRSIPAIQMKINACKNRNIAKSEALQQM